MNTNDAEPTKRDLFAVLILHGFLSCGGMVTEARQLSQRGKGDPDTIMATCAVAMADSLLAALEKTS